MREMPGSHWIALLVLPMCLHLGCSGGSPPGFDGARAFRDLETQCGFGPRVPGTGSHRKMEEWLLGLLTGYADSTSVDSFTIQVEGDTLPEFRNYFAVFHAAAQRRIFLCAHYDTRPVADREKDPAARHRPIPGANDGASGVAVLLEVARILSEKKPPVGVDMAFFDGEDYGDSPDRMLMGSRRFAAENATYRPLFGILLDMVGDRDLRIYQELYSCEASPEIVKRVWEKAKDLGLGDVFIPIPRYAIMDDHIPLLQAGIRCIDIIDFDYPYWHTSGDTPDKCHPGSLKAVGDVLLALIYEAEP